MITAILIDDEPLGIAALRQQLEWSCPQVDVVASCTDARVGMQAILEYEPELVFLDIEMPEMNGFELLAKLGPRSFEVIFVTAYDQYAIKAFDTHAIAYLLKPVQEELLQKAVAHVQSRLETRRQQNELQDFLQKMTQQASGKIALPTADGLEFIATNDLIRLESEGNYTNVFVADGTKYFISKAMKHIAEKLPPTQFIRPHNSHVVNIQFIKRYLRGKGGQLILTDNTVIPVSRSRKQDITHLF